MNQIFIVGLGGFLGAVARYQLSGLVLHRTTAWKFPLSTLGVNVLGCLILGILAGLIEKHDFFNPSTRLFLITGILGGFTTFSAFSFETVYLLQRHDFLWAALYIFLSVFMGIAALWLGIKIQ